MTSSALRTANAVSSTITVSRMIQSRTFTVTGQGGNRASIARIELAAARSPPGGAAAAMQAAHPGDGDAPLVVGKAMRRGSAERIDPLAQLLAGLEVRHVLLRYQHLVTGFRIAAGTRRAVVQAEAAEATDFDAPAIGQRVRHRLQNCLDGEFGVFGFERRVALRKQLDQFRFGHRIPPGLRPPRRARRAPSPISYSLLLWSSFAF